MHDLVWFNGQIADASSAQISALSVAALYGNGVFTTVAVYGGEPFVWEKHLRRLTNDSALLHLDLSQFSDDAIRSGLDELLRRNKVLNGRARITILDESPSDLWATRSRSTTSLLITTADFVALPNKLTLGVSPYSINSASPLAGVKSSNYLERIVSRAESRLAGMDESIQLNQRGEVVSAVMANVFWVKDGTLFTPSIATGCLPGTTREFVLENLVCEEVEVLVSELESAEEMFLTSAGIGVAQVSEFNGRRLGKHPHPITSLLPRV